MSGQVQYRTSLDCCLLLPLTLQERQPLNTAIYYHCPFTGGSPTLLWKSEQMHHILVTYCWVSTLNPFLLLFPPYLLP